MPNITGPWTVHTDGCHQVWTPVGLVAVAHDGNDAGVNDDEQAEAHAHAISAVPLMIEVCKDLMDWQEGTGRFENHWAPAYALPYIIKMARAAYEKATGGDTDA